MALPPFRRGRLCLLLVLFLLLTSCAVPRIPPQTFPPSPEVGIASWYGPQFHGRRTSSGEVFNMHELTAAHRDLPLGTWVEVTNLDNGRSVQVKINDRGPFIKGRIIDLSYAAARAIGMVEQGLARVRVRLTPSPVTGAPAPRRSGFAVQVGSFQARQHAEALRARVADIASGVYIQTVAIANGTYYRVRIGPFPSRTEAARIAARVAAYGYTAILFEEMAATR